MVLGMALQALVLAVATFHLVSASPPKGHMMPLGSHRPPLPIEELDDLPPPATFWNKYIQSQKPVLFRGAAKAYPAAARWTDEYLNSTFGQLLVRLEKKNEFQYIQDVPPRARLSDYFSKLQDTCYVVSQLPSPMHGDVNVLPFTSCGWMSKHIVEVDLWLSNGATHSLVHKDAFNQVNCLLKGRKRWILIDPDQIDKVPMYHETQPPALARAGKSKLDPDKVDLVKWPRLAELEYEATTQNAGDCLFLPGSYLHQVNAESGRSVAVSILYEGPSSLQRYLKTEIPKWEDSTCNDTYDVATKQKPAMRPLSDMFVAWDYDGKSPMTMGIGHPDALREWLLNDVLEEREQVGAEELIQIYSQELQGNLPADLRFMDDDKDMVLDSLMLLMPNRSREDFVVEVPNPQDPNVLHIVNVREIAMKAALDQAREWFHSVDVNHTGVLTKETLSKVTVPQLMGLKGYFYLQALQASVLPSLGEQAGGFNEDDEDGFQQDYWRGQDEDVDGREWEDDEQEEADAREQQEEDKPQRTRRVRDEL